MKKSGIGAGLFFIFIGTIVMLMQFEIIDFSIISFVTSNLITVIAMILIVSGINTMFDYHFVKIITWVAFFAIIIILSHQYSKNDEYKSYENTNKFEIERKDETDYAELDINLGAVKVNINSTDDKLVEGNINGLNFREPVVNYENDNKKANVKLSTPRRFSFLNIEDFFNRNSSGVENSNLHLNEDVLWDINLNLGAVDTKFDMSNLKIQNLELNGGAGSFKLILGERYENTKIDINAGASSFDIYVPEDSGLKVSSTGVLNSLKFNDITLEEKDEYYVSDNFDDAENNIEIDVKMGVGSIKINGIE
ncbi:toast rack family protein [Herbivorax sp. ANBcel31]|uniref:toast rack family protein n=1 Tax=Herbivorax sp. ANBcel31 TaxID=3069754 RepID=UPI0027B3502B|nr:toast rack family protein [Herbivorax sp. ANBcel31]MDQ2086291.1 toast rack family protein [Herbivorax sp. ANBcel31]